MKMAYCLAKVQLLPTTLLLEGFFLSGARNFFYMGVYFLLFDDGDAESGLLPHLILPLGLAS